jgi:hypothetical protein
VWSFILSMPSPLYSCASLVRLLSLVPWLDTSSHFRSPLARTSLLSLEPPPVDVHVYDR